MAAIAPLKASNKDVHATGIEVSEHRPAERFDRPLSLGCPGTFMNNMPSAMQTTTEAAEANNYDHFTRGNVK